MQKYRQIGKYLKKIRPCADRVKIKAIESPNSILREAYEGRREAGNETVNNEETGQSIDIREGFSRGERWAFEMAAREHFAAMVNYVGHLLHDREAAVELVQEAFFLACRSHHRYNPKRPLAPWLFRIARNIAYKEHNRRRKNPMIAMDDVTTDNQTYDPPAKAPSPRSQFADRETRDRLNRALNRLKPTYRDVIILRMIQGLPSETVAHLLVAPIATVNTRLYRALEQLRKYCRQEGIREEEIFE
jgi:RNA polymerase sigma-70 factor (ECF subfamily)